MNLPFTIVVIDDDRDVRLTLAELLAAQGYLVRLATKGSTALDIIRGVEAERCVVLLDMARTEESGDVVLSALRKDGALPRLPVVILSAARPSSAAMAGARLCLHKPFDPQALLRVLAHLCKGSLEATPESHSRLRVAPAWPQPRPLARCKTERSATDGEPVWRRA